MLFRTMLAAVQYRASRLACILLGWSPAFRHHGVGCRDRAACARKIGRVWE
jgi:hypothetical protein